jgi:subtilisin family serine protease
VYVINTTNKSRAEALAKELDASLETDAPVKMSTDQIDWGISRIGANQVWNNASGTGVIVAIIDTGIELTHPDLSNRVTTGYDFVNNDSNPTDDNGHGTHVAGIVASTSNGLGTIGVANTTTLMPIKELNNQGYGYLSDVAKGIYYATDHGAKVINLSLGTTYDSSTLKSAIQYAANKGIFIAAAAGNTSASTCEYPAAYSSSMCVVATDNNNKLASFSNTGGEIAAPGVSNYSTYINGTYRYMSGTSMATPHIAGAAAVIFSYCKDCSSSDVRALIKSTAVDLGNIGIDSVFGAGLVDLVAAIDSLTQEEAATTSPEETPTTAKSQTQVQNKNETKQSMTQTIRITEPQVDEHQRRYTSKTEEILP